LVQATEIVEDKPEKRTAPLLHVCLEKGRRSDKMVGLSNAKNGELTNA